MQAALQRFLDSREPLDLLEVGCGTGHWLRVFAAVTRLVVGVDPSDRMLRRARTGAPQAHLVRAAAEALPFHHRFDRLICVNALHHFKDVRAFANQARQVLRPGGALMTIGLDPHTGADQWWIYDCFPAARELDLQRYPSTAQIRSILLEAGFTDCATEVAQHSPARRTLSEADQEGHLDRTSTSQLMLISEQEYSAGLARLRSAAAQGEEIVLTADLWLYATTGRLESD